jgi:serine/threonine-protein kinase
MGLVVEARPLDGSERVAVKLLQPSALAVPDAVTRFFREANTLARLTSKHAARVFTVGRQADNDLPYMTMELLQGESLAELLKAQGPLPIPRACRYIAEAAEALAEAHALGIIHRDIKPANLFRAADGQGDCIKVIDFGIAKELDSSGPQTHTHMVMGSVAHMAPEQLRAAKYAEPRSDIWALGATLFELLTGKLPFHATSLPQLIVAINCEPPRAPRSLRGEIPPELEAVILRCLEKKPENRFPTAGDFLAALRPFTSEATFPQAPPTEPPPTEPPPTEPPPAPLPRAPLPGPTLAPLPPARRWAWSAVALLVVLVAGLLLGLAGVGKI